MFCSLLLTGCKDIITFDKNKNSYITEPFNNVEESAREE